jgi:hypothetical protein
MSVSKDHAPSRVPLPPSRLRFLPHEVRRQVYRARTELSDERIRSSIVRRGPD